MTPTAAPPPPPAKTVKPAAAKPAAAKKKRRGCLPILILLLLIAAAAFAIYRYPQEIEDLSGWKPPALDLAFLKFGGDEKPSATAKKPKTETEIIKEQLAALAARLKQTETVLNALQSTAIDSADERITRLERQHAQLSRQVATALSRDKDGDNEQAETDVRLIDLSLRLTGDTAAAAADLRRVATTSADASFRPLLLEEAARIETMPARALLLRMLRDLQQKAAPAPTATDTPVDSNSWVGQLGEILNLRREAVPVADTSSPPLTTELRQLELLLLTGDSGEYRRRLGMLLAVVTEGGDDETRRTLEALEQYGEPDYRLQLP